MLARVVVLIVGLIAGSSVFAEPYFAVQTGLKCANCHSNPTGGGLRNAFGSAWGQTQLPSHPIQLEQEQPPGQVANQISRYLAIGTNLRADYTYTDTPNEPAQNEFDLEEARLYLEVMAIPERLSIYIDQLLAPGGSSNREAFVRYWTADHKWYAQAGQMYLPFGWRLEDDTAFIRSITGINMTTPDRGLEVGLETTHWTAQLAISNGTAGASEVDRGKQYSTRVEYVQSIWRLGVSANYNDAAAGARKLGGIFAGVRTGPIAWLAESDYVADDSFPEGERKQLVGLAEANWLIAKGKNLKLTAEYFDPDDDVSEDEQTRYSIVYELTPIQFVQLRLGARFYDGIPQNNSQNRRIAFMQVNGYF